jgi:hypothetical protein
MSINLLRNISEQFGKIAKDDIETGEIILDGKKFKRGKKIKIPKNENEFNDFKLHLEHLSNEQSNTKLKDFVGETNEHIDEEGPIQFLINNCQANFNILYDFTKNDITGLLRDIERNANPKRLNYDMPNFLAYYRPFHYYPNTWGIYLDIDKLIQQGRRVYDYNQQNNCVPNLTLIDSILISFFKTYFHEIYHHKFEMMATKIEIVNRKPFFVEGFNYYYCNTYLTDLCLEEAFANVYGLEKSIKYLKDKCGFRYTENELKNLIRNALLKNASPGYRVAFELTNNFVDKKMSEDRFIELIYKFSYNRIYGNVPNFLNPDIWDLFTYKLDPLVNIKNDVTFVTQI